MNSDSILRKPWFVVGQPWLNSDQLPYIVAGSPDPHAATFVCDLEEIAGDRSVTNAYAIGEHICKLQDAYLRARLKRLRANGAMPHE